MGGRGYHNNVKGYLDALGKIKEFETIYQTEDEKIDFVKDVVAIKNPTTPIFSNSPNKIYVLIGKDDKIKNISIYDENHLMIKSIHLDHSDNKMKEHVHDGDLYHHMPGSGRQLTKEEVQIKKKVLQIYESIKEIKLC